MAKGMQCLLLFTIINTPVRRCSTAPPGADNGAAELMEELLVWLDPFFVLPYRLVGQPEAAYFLGTATLALLTALIGIATLRMAQRMHRKRLKQLQDDMRHYHEMRESALQNSGKGAFRAVNRQGHEAFGYYFSLSNALFVASLWSVPIVLAWMKLRFGLVSPELPISLPLFGNQPSMVFWFILFYIPLRMFSNKTITRWQLRRAEAQGNAPDTFEISPKAPCESSQASHAEADSQPTPSKMDKP